MGIVEKIVEENLGVYRASPTRLQEAQVADDYRGRLAYELLQNADDAMEGATTGRDFVKFLLTEDALWMANSGRPLSDADVQGLCGLGASSKVCAGGFVHLEVLDGGLSVDEVSVVLGIEDSLVNVLTRKSDDRIKAVPEADCQELCAITGKPADQVSTLVARRCFVPSDARAENVLGVGLGVLRTGPTPPSSSNH